MCLYCTCFFLHCIRYHSHLHYCASWVLRPGTVAPQCVVGLRPGTGAH
uniref:Uncharacterized protein n=1 Tax=Anguilla anguilla TaxID=7936 RepID=A0A0E9WAU7_ANGAN